ncbi:MAG: enoyl-CoA hydratase/isomerase family protein, partial [Deltaproteobacteria bacterium]|nr:enoyl-CoA hydratase/isomerase family protein [Deltaproteobacteria bacterium]
DRQGMRAFIHAFERATLDLFTLPLPTAAAIEGHAIAGGTILGLAADFRIAAAGKKLMGLNEIKLGIPVPCLALMMLEQTVSRPVAQEMLYHGEFVKAEQALDTGLVDEVVAPGFAVERALARLASIAAHPGGAFRAMKAARVEIIRDKFERTYVEQHERFLDCWFQADTRVLLEEAAEKFRKGA